MKIRFSIMLLLPIFLLFSFFHAPSGGNAQDHYVVVPGDTLYKIAQEQQTTVEQIKQINGLKSDLIYAGQVLAVPFPARTHTVTKGESLYLIAKKYATTINEIKRLNYLASDLIYVGQVLKIDTREKSRPMVSITGYYTEEESNLPSSSWSTLAHMDNLTQLAPFWFRLNQYDCTDIEASEPLKTSEVRRLVAAAHQQNVPVIPVIHNFLYPNKSLTKNLVTQMLSTPESRSHCIANIIRLIEFYGFDGVNMDFEGIRVSDREKLSLFYQELGDQLRARGYLFTVAIPAKERESWHISWTAPYDYAAIGQAADQVMLMMYNEHGFPGSGPGPVSSIGFNQSVVNYAITQIPRHKIVLAEPVFGFDFNLNTDQHTYLTHEMAMQRVRDYNASPVFDEATQTPYFSYVDPVNQHYHEVWYENAYSLKSKLNLVSEYNLAGVALWRLGMEDPAIWQTIQENR